MKPILALVLCAAVAAQVPHGHLIYANRVASNTVPALGILDPDHGTVTPIVPQAGTLSAHGSRTVAIDPSAPATLYSVTSVSTSIAAVVPVLNLTGNTFVRTTLQVNLGAPGVPIRLRWASGHGLLLLGRGGALNRMYLRDMATGVIVPQPTSGLLPNNASDMAFTGGKAYAASEGDGSAAAVGTIVEWDLVTNTDRVVGTGYPPLYSLAVFAGQLLAGDAVGNVLLIDPTTGAALPFLSTGLGGITSIAVDPLSRVFVLAENAAAWTVHNAFQPAPPLYTSTVAVDEIAVGPTPVATMLTYGSGCLGSNNLRPVLGYTGPPRLGTTFGVTLASARANSGAFLLFGSSRVQDPNGALPRDLASFGMPGCLQYTDIIGTLFLLTGNTGTAQQNFTLPNNPAFTGVRIPMQWLCLDPGVNAFGATTSSGGECYVYWG
ncbi:MAG: hypothetical protein FJ265_17110, partial [Planctomycetes bacterium]|nr:hypothetical protein [Planctomycetota bacterium]